MKSSFRSVRVALVVVGSIGVGAVVNGCSAGPDGSEQTGEANQAMTILPISLLNTITTETGPEDPNADTACYNYHIAVPSLLAGYGCTQGVQFEPDPDSDFNGDGWSYAFACKCAPNPLPVRQLHQDGTLLGLIPPGPISPSEFSEVVYTTNSYGNNACFGTADNGWILVIDQFNWGGLPGGCQGPNCNRLQ